MPKKMRRKANRNAFLAKLVDNEVRVIDGDEFASPRPRLSRRSSALSRSTHRAGRAPMDDAGEKRVLSARNLESVTLPRRSAQRVQHAEPPLPGDRQGRS
jgi:ribosomal protein L4